MNNDRTTRDRALAALQRALEDWASHGNGHELPRWPDQERGDGQGARARPWRGSKRALAVLGTDCPVAGEFLAIDHGEAGSSCRFELFGAGRSWLGPSWTIDGAGVATSRPAPQSWISDSSCGLAEWSYRAAGSRITQSAILLCGRSLALLSLVIVNRSLVSPTLSMSLALPPRIVASPDENSRALLLTAPKTLGSAQVLPIGLPARPYPTDRGSFHALDRALVLSQAGVSRRSWLPLLVSWDRRRNRKVVHWRELTVSEKSRKVQSDRACAVRVSWGREETYVIYRSLGPPAPRAFLGHQTTARLLVGSFKSDGSVEPILKVE